VVPAWDSLDPEAQRLYARLQETFCGFVDHTDAQIGRLMDALRELGVFENTAVIFLSDNGASSEGGQHGTTNTERFRNLMFMEVDEMVDDIDHMGSRHTDPHYPIGWSQAGNAPFQRWKRDTHRGGNTDPLIIHWPSQIDPEDRGAIRNQYHHITDLFPTLLDLAGLPVPQRVNGVDQQPLEGVSLAATIVNGDAPNVKATQYYEMLGSRAIWHEGWTAVTWHKPGTDWADDPWELYHQDADYSQAHDLANEHPEKLAELIDLWWEEARKHNVLPLDDRGRERFIDPTRPTASEDREVYRYYCGTTPIPNPSLPVILNTPHKITARLTAQSSDEGVLVSQGGELAGWVLFVQNRRAHYVHNVLKIEMTEVVSAEPLPTGREIELAVIYEPIEQGWGRATMTLDGVKVGVNERMRITPMGYSMVQEGFAVGKSWGTPVAFDRYQGTYEFTGDLRVVEMSTDPLRQVWTPRSEWKMS
jgi:arylsulfatase